MNALTLIEQYTTKARSPLEVMRETLQRVERLEPKINAFQHLDAERALRDAAQSTERWTAGSPMGALDGLPVAIKDLTLVAGWPTRSGSLTVDIERQWNEDAPCVARLREAGAIVFGKTTTPEFGWKGLTDSPLSGYTRNPWELSRSSGGSSGGAAAALAAGIGAFAHATDGGGSIRIPASYCGLFGFKPSLGRVPAYPREGAFATLSSEGPIARSVSDAVLMLNVMTGADARDWYALPRDGRDYFEHLDDGVRGIRIALCTRLGGASPQPDIAAAVESAAGEFEALGAVVEPVETVFEPLRPDFERYWLANLARRVMAAPADKRELIDPDLRRVAALGENVSLAEFSNAVTARARLGALMNQFHESYDLLLCPTMPTDPPLAETPYHTESFDRWDHAVPYTVPFNLTGQPAASIPCGLSQAGLPIGLQIVGPAYADALVLRAARAFETVHPVTAPAEISV